LAVIRSGDCVILNSNCVTLEPSNELTFVPIKQNSNNIIMKKVKMIGIWMDHCDAYLLESIDGEIAERIIVSEFTEQEKESSLDKGEKFMNHKESQMQAKYFRRLSDSMKDYDEILLFGPTEAKNELFNLLKADHFFDGKKIELKNTDKMTAGEMHRFVIEYFKL